jgi:hypothetical protein
MQDNWPMVLWASSLAAGFILLSVCFLCAGLAAHFRQMALRKRGQRSRAKLLATRMHDTMGRTSSGIGDQHTGARRDKVRNAHTARARHPTGARAGQHTEARPRRHAQSSRERGKESRLMRLERALQVLRDLDAQYDLELQVLTRDQPGPEQGGSNHATGARLQRSCRYPHGAYRSCAEMTEWRSAKHSVAGAVLQGSSGSSLDSYSPPRRMTLWSHQSKLRSSWNSKNGSPVQASARGKSRCYAAACDEARLREAREASRLVVVESLRVLQR